MIPELNPEQLGNEALLTSDFTERLEHSLRAADRDRRRRDIVRRLRVGLPALLLVGPLVWWRITSAGADGAQAAIHAITWLTFLLDVGVHVDSAILSYLNLQFLPSAVGLLLLVVITGWLLFYEKGNE